jgi:uncharacterized phiE125 gp8 family phage protein
VELPVTLERARMHLRNEDLAFDEDYLRGVIKAAGDMVERVYGVALLTQTIKQYHSHFPCSPDTSLSLRITPLISITSIQYVDSAGATQTWSSAEYTTGAFNGRYFVVPKVDYSWPSDIATGQPNAITVTYTAGYGAKPSNIPHSVMMGLLMEIAYLYGPGRDNPVRTMSTAAEYYLQPLYQFSC